MRKRKKLILQTATCAARFLPVGMKKAIYRIPFLSRMVRRSLNAAVPKGIQEVKVAAGALKDMRLLLDLQTEKDYWLGTYETDLQEAAAHFIQPGMTVYDLGANIGYISLMAARLVGASGKVFAFEALPSNIERLRNNVALNQMEERVQIIHSAVLDQSGETTFLIHASGAMGKAKGSAGRQTDYEDAILVPAVSLDDFVLRDKKPAPDVIKMDIEGGEILAVAGMRKLLGAIRPILLIELHGEEAARAVWETLTTKGYAFHAMRSGFPTTHLSDKPNWKAYIVVMPEHVLPSKTENR